MNTDQIKITYGNYGETVQKIEMLLVPKAKLTLELNDDNTVQFTTSDTDFDNNNLNGQLNYNTVDTLIRQLIKMRSQLAK